MDAFSSSGENADDAWREYRTTYNRALEDGTITPEEQARLRKDRPELPIVFITGHAETSELKGELVLQKPFGHAELADTVLKMLGRTPAETVS